MEESGSEGLDELIFAQKDSFFKDVDYVCISDNYWLGKKKPCITYGLRGICYFFIEVLCGVCVSWCLPQPRAPVLPWPAAGRYLEAGPLLLEKQSLLSAPALAGRKPPL